METRRNKIGFRLNGQPTEVIVTGRVENNESLVPVVEEAITVSNAQMNLIDKIGNLAEMITKNDFSCRTEVEKDAILTEFINSIELNTELNLRR